MPRKPRKKYAAFISCASSDRLLAIAVKMMLDRLGLTVFVGDQDLRNLARSDWSAEIVAAIHASSSFLVIATQHGMNRKWVDFELGVAAGDGLPLYGATVATTARRDLNQLPGPQLLGYRLHDADELAQLLQAIGKAHGKEFPTAVVHDTAKSPEGLRVLTLARVRRVFIVGSPPRNCQIFNRLELAPQYHDGLSIVADDREPARREEALGRIATDVTRELLENGFHVRTCPDVPCVGESVAAAVYAWAARDPATVRERYSRGGVYNLEQQRPSKPEERTAFEEHIKEQRDFDLRNVDYLLILGGNEGTRDEFRAALRLGIKIIAIPSTGGTARIAYDEIHLAHPQPYEPGKNHWSYSCARQLARWILQDDGKGGLAAGT